MNWEDFIGLIISLGAFLYLMFRGSFKKTHVHNEKKSKAPSFSPPLPKKEIAFSPKKAAFKNSKPKEAYEVIGKEKISKAKHLVRNLRSKKEMVILSEIIGRPKSL